jgi:hypothetical protein
MDNKITDYNIILIHYLIYILFFREYMKNLYMRHKWKKTANN